MATAALPAEPPASGWRAASQQLHATSDDEPYATATPPASGDVEGALSRVDVETPESRAFIEGVEFGRRTAGTESAGLDVAALQSLGATLRSETSACGPSRRCTNEPCDECVFEAAVAAAVAAHAVTPPASGDVDVIHRPDGREALSLGEVLRTMRTSLRTNPKDRFWEGYDSAIVTVEVALERLAALTESREP